MIPLLRDKYLQVCRLFIIVFVAILFSACATRQDVIYLHRQIKDLETRISQLDLQQKQLKDRVDKVIVPLQDFQASFVVRMDNMDSDIRSLRGDMELLNHRADKIEDQLKSLDGGIAKKNKQSEDSRASAVKEISQGEELALKEGEKESTPEGDYKKAKALYKDALYGASRKAFETFIARYPGHKLTGNAQFWLAETYFKDGDYKRSILEYQKLIDHFKGHPKVPSAYLKQGLAFLQMGDSFSGKLVLNKLIKLFPDTDQAKIAKKKLSGLKKDK